jgi:hypothetical protein
MRVFLALGDARPVPGVLDCSSVSHVTQQRLGASEQTGEEEMGLVGWLTVAYAHIAYGDHLGPARPFLQHPLRAGMARSVQVLSQPCLHSPLLACNDAFLP